MLKVRQITNLDADYPVVSGWWEAHGFPTIPREALSTLGFVVEIVGADGEGEPVVAGWVYTASTNALAMMEWIVSNPAASPLTVARAIQALAEVAADECKARGYAIVLTAIKLPSLGRVLERAGFLKQDEGMTHYVKILR